MAKRPLCAVVLGVLSLAFASRAASEDAPPTDAVVRAGNRACPVKGGPVDARYRTTWKGMQIEFSCAECPATFLADPVPYLPALVKDLATQLTETRTRLEKYEPAMKPPESAAPAVLSPAADAVVSAYLGVARALAADDDKGAAVAADALVEKAKALEEAAKSTEHAALASQLREKAVAASSPSIAARRKAFPAMGAAVISLVDAVPPSASVGGPLYVVHCPMFPGDWIQRGDVVANPFYGQAMAKCGSVVRKVATGASK